MRNPFAVAALEQNRLNASAFKGASADRLFYDWAVGASHPDSEIRYALRDLRARARDLRKNNPYATGIVDSFTDNIIGWDGIKLNPEVRGRDGAMARSVNDDIQIGWDDWGFDHASVDGHDNWIDLQRLIVGTWVTDGEVFIWQRRGWDNPHAYAVQLLDADLLDETFNVQPDERGVEIKMGIELDRFGRRLAYHFFERHPLDIARSNRKRFRVPADEIIHFFVRYRTGQNRGYSLFAPVLTTVKMIDGITEAELVATRMSAAKMGFITNDSPEAIAAYAARLAAHNDDGTDASPRPLDIAPGLIEELIPGQSFTAFDPDHPNTAFEVFLKVMLRGVSRGFGISYLTLTGDVGEANYSSMRAGLIPERDHWCVLQAATYNRVHRSVYHSWRASAMLTGALRLPTAVSADFKEHTWRPRGWKWVDPVKDIDAAERGVKLGVNSRTRIAAEQGADFERVVDEIQDEEEYAKGQGVDVSGMDMASRRPRRVATAVVPDNPEDDAVDARFGNGAAPMNRIKGVTDGAY